VTKVNKGGELQYLIGIGNANDGKIEIPAGTGAGGTILVNFNYFMRLMCKIGRGIDNSKDLNIKSSLSAFPIKGDIRKYTSSYGYRIHPIEKTKKHHDGVDFSSGGSHLPLVAMYAGVVVDFKFMGPKGNTVTIESTASNGEKIQYLYAHMHTSAAPWVSKDDLVGAGQQVGLVGATGGDYDVHLHLVVWKVKANGTRTEVNPNPNYYWHSGFVKDGVAYNNYKWKTGHYSYIPE